MKKFFLTLFFSFVAISLYAQSSMTDKQVMDYVIKQHEKGESQTEIAQELLKKGVDISQLQRIRRKYQDTQGLSSESLSDKDGKDVTSGRIRKANGETKKKSDAKGTKPGKSSKADKSETEDIEKELFELIPDSLDVKKDKEEKKIFGHDIFRNENLSFEPNMNIATPETYVLGPGDNVYIDIYGASQETIDDVISPDGYVTIEDYGPIALSGLTVKQATSKLRAELGSRYESSSIKLSVGQTRTIMVNVMGEVEVPGTYTLSAFATVFHALYMAGGVNDIGTLRDVKVYRKNVLVTSVDVYDYLLNGKLTGNVKLQDNDVVIVGSYDCLVEVKGKVKRPMYYEMKHNESLKELLNYAGGFTGDAYSHSVRVLRKTGRDLSVYNVEEGEMGDFKMADEDKVQVDSIIQRYSNAVELKGAVFRPGLYQIGGKVLTVKNLIDYAEGVTEDAFLKHAVLHRMKLDRTLEVVQVDLEGIMNGSAKDIYLQNEDILFVPSQEELKQSQTLTIHGEVFYPGTYKYASNETIEDLILQAGGLMESASSIKVDVARRIKDQKATQTSEMRAMTYSFELRDGFIVNADPEFTLQPYDEVYVRRSPGYSEQENVKVTGEVLFSGTYTLAKRETRLSDIIKEAGGVTPMAYVKGARLERKSTDEEKLRTQQLLKMSQTKTGKDTLDIKKLDVSETYFVGIDLEKALANPGGDDDIVLHEGDNIIVPELVNTVKINGEVMYPNTVGYLSGKGARYYISQAGGYSNTARRNRAYIIYQNGKVAKLRSHAKPAPGCEIVVPSKQKKDNSSATTQWVTISTSVATLAALLVSLFK